MLVGTGELAYFIKRPHCLFFSTFSGVFLSGNLEKRPSLESRPIWVHSRTLIYIHAKPPSLGFICQAVTKEVLKKLDTTACSFRLRRRFSNYLAYFLLPPPKSLFFFGYFLSLTLPNCSPLPMPRAILEYLGDRLKQKIVDPQLFPLPFVSIPLKDRPAGKLSSGSLGGNPSGVFAGSPCISFSFGAWKTWR